MHSITKGFTALHRGELPLLVLGRALRRLPPKVQAGNCVFLYDNACKAHKSALRDSHTDFETGFLQLIENTGQTILPAPTATI